MNNQKLPDSEHVARYCKPTQTRGGIQPSAFILRESEISLSVNWLEYLDKENRNNQIIHLRDIFDKKGYTVKRDGKFAILNVGAVRNKTKDGTPDNRNLEFIHEFFDDIDTSHCGIHNLKPDNELIAELIVETIRETYPGRE